MVLWLAFGLLTAATGGGAPPKAQVVVTVHPPGALPQGELLLRRADGKGEDLRRLPLKALTQLELPRGSFWEVQAEAAGYWGAPAIIGEGETKTVHLWRCATVSLAFDVPVKTEAPPSQAWVRFWGKVEGSELSGQVPCTLSSNTVTCSVPAAHLDLLVRLPGYASEPVWDVHLEPAKTWTVPRRTLRPGASVLGFLVASHGGPAEGQVELHPWDPSDSRVPSNPPTGLRVVTGPNGFFQFVGVPAGTYRVHARGAKGGEATLGPVTVERGRETEITKPLALAEPVAVEVHVLPATMPQGPAWKLEWVSLSPHGGGDSVRERLVPPEGRLVLDGVLPGEYMAVLVSSVNQQEIWLRRAVSVPQERQLVLEVPVVRVAGQVREGEKPLPALVAFGGVNIGAVKVVLQANEEGSFEGFLPRAGSWEVAIVVRPRGVLWRGEVEVPAPRGGKPSWVEINVASARVSGRVVDGEGTAQPRAALWVQPIDPPSSPFPAGRTREDGSFTCELPPGRLTLQAQSGERVSPPRPLNLKTGEHARGVELVVEDFHFLEGQLVGFPQGAARSVQVSAFLTPATSATSLEQTDGEGRFRFRLDPGVDGATVIAHPPVGNLLIACTPIPAPGPLALPASLGPGGTLEVLEVGDLRPLQVMFRYQGCPAFASAALFQWTRLVGEQPARGGHWVFPKLPPGLWEVCSWEWSGDKVLIGPCHGGVLPPGGTLQLKPPRG